MNSEETKFDNKRVDNQQANNSNTPPDVVYVNNTSSNGEKIAIAAVGTVAGAAASVAGLGAIGMAMKQEDDAEAAKTSADNAVQAQKEAEEASKNTAASVSHSSSNHTSHTTEYDNNENVDNTEHANLHSASNEEYSTQDPEVKVLGVEVVGNDNGGKDTLYGVEINGERGILVDVNSDGTIDVAIHDDNANGTLEEYEMHDISNAGITTNDLAVASHTSLDNNDAATNVTTLGFQETTEPEVRLLGSAVVDNEDGTHDTVYGLSVNGDDGLLVDIHSDGTIDLAIDVDEQGNYRPEDVRDVSSYGMTTDSMDRMISAQSLSVEEMQQESENYGSGDPDYTNNADAHAYTTSYVEGEEVATAANADTEQQPIDAQLVASAETIETHSPEIDQVEIQDDTIEVTLETQEDVATIETPIEASEVSAETVETTSDTAEYMTEVNESSQEQYDTTDVTYDLSSENESYDTAANDYPQDTIDYNTAADNTEDFTASTDCSSDYTADVDYMNEANTEDYS